jgi:uncharacterized protein
LSKFLLLVFVLVAVWLLLKRVRGADKAKDAPDSAAHGPATEQMVNCSHCGLYLPQKEAVAEGGKFYCCAEHRRRAA